MTAATSMAAATSVAAALSTGAALTAPIMPSIPSVTLPVSRLVGMEVIERLFPTRWNGSMVTATRIIAIVNVAVKAARATKPWASPDE